MAFGSRVRTSFAQFWNSPALLSVLLLEFILTSLLGVLFFMGDYTLLLYLNKSAIAAMPGTFDWRVLLNTKTVIAASILIIIQGLIFVYVDSFFKAGFYGMMKNAVQDGSTVFAEFVPSAKRYWYALFRLLLLRYAIMLLVSIPFIVVLIRLVATTPAFVTPEQTMIVGTLFFATAFLWLLIFFWLLYAEAIIVFDDAEAIPAAKQSMRLAGEHIGTTLLAVLTFAGLLVAGIIVATLLGLPFELIAKNTGAMEWAVVSDIVQFILNIVTISATIIATFFVFYTYRTLSKEPAHAPAKATRPTKK